MATVYTFGPRPGGAGTQVKVTDTSPQVSPGRLGVTVIVGAFAKGIASVASRYLDKTHFRRVGGRPLRTGWYTGQGAEAFFEIAKGAGELYGYRVAASSGLEDKIGKLKLYARKCLGSRVVGRSVPGTHERTIALRAYALSPGDWSGPAFDFGGVVDDSTIAGNTIELSTDYSGVFLADELIGATFMLSTWGVSLTVLGNTAGDDADGPVLTLHRGFTGYTAAGSVGFTLARTAVDADGAAMAAAVSVGDGGTDRNGTTKFDVSLDGTPVRSFDGVDLTDLDALTEAINTGIVSGYAEVGFDADGQTIDDEGAEENRPCNWSGIALPDDDNLGKARYENGKLYLQIHELVIDTLDSGGTPKLTAEPTFPSSVVPSVIEITFTGAADFTVTAVDPYTGDTIVPAADRPAGATGSEWSPTGDGAPALPTFTFAVDGTIAAGTKLRLYVLPLPSGLARLGGRLFPAAWNGAGYTPTSTDPGSNPAKPGTTTSWAVVDNGANWVKVSAGGADLATVVQAPKAPWHRGTDTDATVDTTGGKTFIAQVKIAGVSETAITVVIADDGAAVPKQDLADTLNADGGFSAAMFAEVDSTNRLIVWLNRGDAGELARITVTTGTINSEIGITNNTSKDGQSGSPVRLQWAQSLRGARPESAAVTNDDLVDALELNPDSALVQFLQATPGVVALCLPGVTDSAVQEAAFAFGRQFGAWVYFDFPDSITDELAAVAYRRSTFEFDGFGQWFFPGYGKTVRSPRLESGREIVPLSSALAGAAARWANDATEGKGFHKPLAGQKCNLGPYIGSLVRDPATVPTPAQLLAAPRVRDDLLNPGGVCAVAQSGALIYPFGDEIVSSSGKGTSWAHKVKAVLHVVGLLRANGDQFVYRLNNPDLRIDALNVAVELMTPLFRAGWFDTLEDGLAQTFENCVALQCDANNNPSEIADAGQFVCSVRFRIVNVAKVVEFQIGTKGLSVGA